MKFPYVRDGVIYMPLIPVTLKRGDHEISTEALVDSGAAECIFDAQFAEVLGIENVEDGEPVEFEGVSGHKLLGYRHAFDLVVGGYTFPTASIAFSYHMPDNAVNILGQLGFFQHCPIKFTYRAREVDVMTTSIRRT